MAHATVLFNSAVLDIVLASSPALIASAPASTSLASLADDALAGETDAWVEALLAARRRPALYFDERVTLHLVLTLPASSSSSPASPPLNRAQAATLLLQSLPTPHLQLAADLTYIDAAPAPPPLPARTSSLQARVPLTPAPFPALAADGPAADASAQEVSSILVRQGTPQQGVQVASVQFEDGDDARVWVAKGRKEGEWVGVWELSCEIAFLRTQLRDPRLSITVTVTLRDDPELGVLLDKAKDGAVVGAGSIGRDSAGEAEDDEDYMVDSYDDVNLLSALAPISSVPLHLPFSRLPTSYLPRMPPPSLPVPRARSFSVSHTRTLSAGFATSNELHHPSLRRSFRRILPIRAAVQLDLRTVPCPVGALGLPEGVQVWERNEDEDGVLLCVEVRGPARASHDEAFDIERIDVHIEGAVSSASCALSSSAAGFGAAHSVEVRPVAFDRSPQWPIRVCGGGASQQNFVYALAGVSTLAPGSSLPGNSDGDGPALGSVPIAVASSPQQRFTARFGAEEAMGGVLVAAVAQGERRGSLAQVVGGAAADGQRGSFFRNVTVVVTGRPVVLSRQGSEEAGYNVPDSAGAEEETKIDTQEQVESRTPTFLSRWNFTLDISSFARRSPPRSAVFGQTVGPALPPTSTGAPPVRPTAHAEPRLPALPLRPSPATNVEVESIAGSKRHTMSSLASLSLRSPVMARKGSLGRVHSTRALPPTPLSPPAPAAPHGAKRFFSVPQPQPQDVAPSLTAMGPVATLVRTETPPPMHAPEGKRASLPSRSVGGLLDARPKEPRRTSWMSNLVPGASGSGDTAPAEGKGSTSWDAPSPNVGLGLGDSTLVPQEDGPSYPPPPPEQRFGKLLVSVSLVPLRAAKSRRGPFAGAAGHARTASSVGRTNENLPPAVLPGLAPFSPDSGPSSHANATPRFAFPPAPSLSSAASPSPGDSPAVPSPPVPSSSSLAQPSGDGALRALAEQSNRATCRMPRVNVLDVFLVEVFVFNRSEQVKRLTVGVPAVRPEPLEKGGAAGLERRREEKVARLVPLENDVRIGPLAPNSCASVGIRFLAIRPGAHVVEELRLVDLADGSETRLERPVWVVVE